MNYETIVQNFRTSHMFNYALYKLGWVYFNLREFERAVETFQAVVREIDKSKTKQIEFRDQALNDLVPAYAELERGWPLAKAYYTKVEGEKKMWLRLEKLAGLYVANDKQELAIELHAHFIEEKPTDPRCVDWWETIVDIYMGLEKFDDIENAIRKFLAFTDERTAPWVAANKANAEKMEKAAKLGETYLIFMSNHFHQTAQKIEEQQKSMEAARPYYVKAAADYAEFVRRYPESKKAYIVNFYYAEILFLQLKDFAKAREQYKRVIERDKQGEYLEDAALGVIYSVEELLKRTRARYDYDKKQWIDDASAPPLVVVQTSEGATTVQKTKLSAESNVTEEEIKAAQVPKKRQELHPLERDFVDAADKYVTLMEELKKAKGEPWMKKKGRGKDVPGIMYVAAATYYERGQYPESIERLERVYRYDQARVESEIAVKTLIDIYARQKNWVKIEEWARAMLARKKMLLFKVKDLRKYVAVSVGEQARELAERKDFEGAHAKYDTILSEFRKDEPELAAISLFNKAAIYEIQKEEKKAIQTYERVVKEFKNSEVAPEAMFNIGMIYEAQTQFRDAADAFLRMAKIRKNANAAQALINAGQILNALGQHKEAIAAYGDFIKVAGGLGDKEADSKRLAALIPDAHLEIGRVNERMGGAGAGAALKAYALVAARFGARPELQVEAIGRSMKILIEQDRGAKKPKNGKKITDYIKQVLKIWENPAARAGNAQYYFAQSLFQSAEFLFDTFAKLTLRDVRDVKGLRPMLEKQATTLKAAEKAYFEVIDSTSSGQGKYFAACAAYKVGMLYFRFKEDLFNAPLPKQVERAVEAGFTEVEDRYRQAIEQVAAPIEEQSLVALRGAIQTAHNLGAYNDCTRQAGEVAAKVNPNEYPTVEKDPNLPKATTALNSSKTTDTATSAAFITRVRRGKFTVSYKPEDIKKKLDEKPPAERRQ
jgi:tetratricopeptide (TPR) repeat protein